MFEAAASAGRIAKAAFWGSTFLPLWELDADELTRVRCCVEVYIYCIKHKVYIGAHARRAHIDLAFLD